MRFILLQAFRDVMSLISLCYIVCLFILKRYNKMQLGMFSDEMCACQSCTVCIFVCIQMCIRSFLLPFSFFDHLPSSFTPLFNHICLCLCFSAALYSPLSFSSGRGGGK